MQSRIGFATNITAFSFSMQANMLMHSWLSHSCVVTKFTMNRWFTMNNWHMWVQIGYSIEATLVLLTKIWLWIWVMGFDVSDQCEARANNIFTNGTCSLLGHTSNCRHFVLSLRGLYQLFSLSFCSRGGFTGSSACWKLHIFLRDGMPTMPCD